MKLFGVDFDKRYIIFKVDDSDVLIAFDEAFSKGIHNVEVRVNGKEKVIEVESTYPGFIRRVREAVLITLVELKHAINSITNRSC